MSGGGGINWTRLIRLLIAEGLLDAREVIEGDVTIRDTSRRNQNAVVTTKAGRGYFVKLERESAREAGRYALLASVPGLGDAVPAVARADLHGHLVLEAESGAADLVTHHGVAGFVEPEIGRAVGRTLAALHRETRVAAPAIAPEEAPGVLWIHRPGLEALGALSPATIELTRVVQGHPSLGAALDALRQGWRRETLIHNDVKWANILVVPNDDGPPSVRLIDWEHAEEGEPAWDLGSALAGYVTAWIDSIPRAPAGTTAADQAESATAPLHAMRESIAALWQGYRDGLDIAPEQVDGLRRRTVSFCAVRLIRTASEETMVRASMSRRVVRLMQVAANVLDDPDAAAERLLGLTA